MVNAQEQLLKNIAVVLDKAEVPYMLTGAYAVIYYGRPRASHDIDFVVEISGSEDVGRVETALESLPFDFSVSRNDIMVAVEKKSMFQAMYYPVMAKVDFWILKDTDFDKERFMRRQKHGVLGVDMWLSSPEDTVLQKLRWYAMGKIEKHLVDAAFVWQIQGPKLDKSYIKKWVKKLGMDKYLAKLDKIDIEAHY